jgi:hypothetical protein
VGIVLAIVLLWVVFALGLAVVVGRLVRLADQRDLLPWVEIPDVSAFDEVAGEHVR